MYKMENRQITVTISFEENKQITGTAINGEIVKFEKPVTGAWCVEANPKNNQFIDEIGYYSVVYYLTEEDAFKRAIDCLKKTA